MQRRNASKPLKTRLLSLFRIIEFGVAVPFELRLFSFLMVVEMRISVTLYLRSAALLLNSWIFLIFQCRTSKTAKPLIASLKILETFRITQYMSAIFAYRKFMQIMHKPIQFFDIPPSYQFWIQLIKPCPNMIIFMMSIPAISNRPNVRTTVFLNVF